MSMSNEKLLELADQLDRATGLYLLGKDRIQLGVHKTHELAAALRFVVNMRVNPIVKIVKPGDDLVT